VFQNNDLAYRIATAAFHNLEDPSFANILELIEDNLEVFNPKIDVCRLAAQARQILLTS
jgi:hypothetical protein